MSVNHKKRRRNASAFPRQKIERTAGGASVHDLKADLPKVKQLAGFVRRKNDAPAGAEQDHFWFQFDDGLNMRLPQVARLLWQTTFDNRFGCHYNA